MQLVKSHKTFGGTTSFWAHDSQETATPMRFATFVPGARKVDRALIWLSGLTCSEENFIVKAGVQRLLADSGTMVIAPDTSPRGLNLPGEHDSYDFGSGAGFYLDATVGDYAQHYRMYSYIVNELTAIARQEFHVDQLAIAGHSMGGHGALVLGLRNPHLFSHVVAFAPIVNPTHVPWGVKAFTGYLGGSEEARRDWEKYDACHLLKSGHRHANTIAVFQGTADEFLGGQLQPEVFAQAAREVGQKHELHWCEGYDHSYYFIQTFLGEALAPFIA